MAIEPTYLQFSDPVTKGALYYPDGKAAPRVALLVMHRTSNYLPHIANIELSKRGFVMLGMNPRFDNNETIVDFEEVALDVKAGVELLRGLPGIEKVLLLGHSGGGPTMTFYQAVAENGVAFCEDSKKIKQCHGALVDLPAVDGIVLMDANPGHSVHRLRNMMPMCAGATDPNDVDPKLDPFNPDNGFNPKGASHYSDDFKVRYFKAQSSRMNALISEAQTRLEAIEAGKGPYPDDDVFPIVRGEGACLWNLDPSVAHETVKPQQLLHSDGSITKEIVKNVRVADQGLDVVNATFSAGTVLLTLRSFLSTQSIRSSDARDGVDWCSSNNSTTCALEHISVPLMIATMGAWIYMRDNEIHYERAASKDKDFIVVEGALHELEPCVACEKKPGQYANTIPNLFNYTREWINARF